MTYYTKHLVLLWKRALLRGERTRLGGSKRVMLSLAEAPLAVLTRGAEVGMLAEYSVRSSKMSVSRDQEGFHKAGAEWEESVGGEMHPPW